MVFFVITHKLWKWLFEITTALHSLLEYTKHKVHGMVWYGINKFNKFAGSTQHQSQSRSLIYLKVPFSLLLTVNWTAPVSRAVNHNAITPTRPQIEWHHTHMSTPNRFIYSRSSKTWKNPGSRIHVSNNKIVSNVGIHIIYWLLCFRLGLNCC